MSIFNDLRSRFADEAILRVHGEPVVYTHSGGRVRRFRAEVIEAVDDASAPEFGLSPRRGGRNPITVRASKTDLPSVLEQRDTIEWRGTTYTVAGVLGDEVSMWRLYAV